MRSAIALRDVVGRRLRGASSSLSRTTSDFEILRPRDSASMSATNGSGNRTVRVFMLTLYYIDGRYARHRDKRPSRVVLDQETCQFCWLLSPSWALFSDADTTTGKSERISTTSGRGSVWLRQAG